MPVTTISAKPEEIKLLFACDSIKLVMFIGNVRHNLYRNGKHLFEYCRRLFRAKAADIGVMDLTDYTSILA